jgi:Flp pilus assembly pilin Flp
MPKFLLDESGQGMVEYALILLIIAAALITGLGWITGGLTEIFRRISSNLGSAAA